MNGQPRPKGYSFDTINLAYNAGVVPQEFGGLFSISRSKRMISWFSSGMNPYDMMQFAMSRKGRLTKADVKAVVVAEYEPIVDDLFTKNEVDSSRDPAYFTPEEINDIIYNRFDPTNSGAFDIMAVYKGVVEVTEALQVKFID